VVPVTAKLPAVVVITAGGLAVGAVVGSVGGVVSGSVGGVVGGGGLSTGAIGLTAHNSVPTVPLFALKNKVVAEAAK
jgi:hypothetical protein